MLLQKRTILESRRRVYERDDQAVHDDPLFDSDWEIFVVKRDPETGEFVTATVAADEAEKLC